MNIPTIDRFRGSFFGLAVGDALGGRFEAQTADYVRSRFPASGDLINSGHDELWYTDDTQMAIGVAECLAEHSRIIENHLCDAFVSNYVPSRGYGRGARLVLNAMEAGRDHRAIAQQHFPGGSYGNGAAMRVAPVGLFFRDDYSTLLAEARLSALPTHVHPLGIEGAQLLALSVAVASHMPEFSRDEFYAELSARCTLPEYAAKIRKAAEITSIDELASLGNGIQALESVVTAIACFTLNPHSYDQTIENAILLGGDTDTIAAMAGAVAGAHLGLEAVPLVLRNRIEDSPKGKKYLAELSDRLYATYTDSQ